MEKDVLEKYKMNSRAEAVCIFEKSMERDTTALPIM